MDGETLYMEGTCQQPSLYAAPTGPSGGQNPSTGRCFRSHVSCVSFVFRLPLSHRLAIMHRNEKRKASHGKGELEEAFDARKTEWGRKKKRKEKEKERRTTFSRRDRWRRFLFALHSVLFFGVPLFENFCRQDAAMVVL